MDNSQSEKTILLVEDNADDVELTYRLFEKCGVAPQVQVAKDGQEALDIVFGPRSSATPGIAKTLKLILLDLNLPKVPGVEVLRRLQNDDRTQSIAIAVLTITGRERESLEKEPFHISAYLRKPLELHSFLNLYYSIIGKPNPQ